VIEPVTPDAAAFAAVFTGFDRFAPGVTPRLLIYPTAPYGLSDEQLAALIDATANEAAYLSTVVPGQPGGEHYLLSPLESYGDSALDVTKLSPHAIYSRRGEWGVLATLEEEAYVGGVDLHLPRSAEEMARDWLAALAAVERAYPERRMREWARDRLAHLYGEDEAARLTSG
jgi:hypothetical protein